MTTIGRMMILEISNSRRAEIKSCVISVLKEYGQPYVPVKIGNLIRNIPYIKLVTYSSQIRKFQITYKELIVDAETKDSYAVWNRTQDRYCIYYNDIEPNIVNSNRVRWNLAHELGHIILKHHAFCKQDKLFRSGLATNVYNYIEAEADYFAQLLLVPHVVLYAFKVTTEKQLKDLCQISGPAAKNRFRDYKQWIKQINGNDDYDKPLFHYYYNFIYKKHCLTCGASIIQSNGKYCPICGNNTLQWGDGKMKYTTKIVLDQNSKAIRCPVCDNEEISPNGNYCHICGTYLVNQCTNIGDHYDSCGQLAAANARYCIHCGAPTTFFKAHLLKAWNQQYSFSCEDIPDDILDIPDDVDTGFPEDEGLPFN